MNKLIIIAACLLLLASCGTEENNKPIAVKNGEVNIAYTKEGKGDTALVFLHGWGINKEYWNEQAATFKDRYTVVLVDLGGHGESGTNRNSWKVEDFSNDVMAVLDSLNLNKIILVGHSMSGDIMLDIAYKIPDRITGLIGIDNFKHVGAQLTAEQNIQMQDFIGALHASYKQTAFAYSKANLFPPEYADTTSVNRVLKDITNTDSVVAINAITSVMDFSSKEPALLQEMHHPLHLILSDYTPVAQDSLAKYCKAGFSIKTIHGTGHYPMIEKPQEFDRLLKETLDEIAMGK